MSLFPVVLQVWWLMRIIASPFGKVHLWGRGAGRWHSLESHCQRQLFGPSCFGFDPTTARSFPSFLLTQKKSVVGGFLQQVLGVFKHLFLGPKNTLLTSFIYFFIVVHCFFCWRERSQQPKNLLIPTLKTARIKQSMDPIWTCRIGFLGTKIFHQSCYGVAYFRIVFF